MPARNHKIAPRMGPSRQPAARLYDPGKVSAVRHGVTRSASMSIAYKRDQRPGLYCVELRTDQWTRAVQWYREALGLKVLVRAVDDGYALFEAGETRLAILGRKTAGEASPRWSLGFEVQNLEMVAARLLDAGSPVTRPRSNAEGFQELITADPDGNTIRLFAWPNG
jgi:predicted enzyme related to lactoylglutathione lyase